jgi:hypothetical protein
VTWAGGIDFILGVGVVKWNYDGLFNVGWKGPRASRAIKVRGNRGGPKIRESAEWMYLQVRIWIRVRRFFSCDGSQVVECAAAMSLPLSEVLSVGSILGGDSIQAVTADA